MDTTNLWETLDWTIHARKLIAGLYKFPINQKIILLLRHSERDEIDSVWHPKELLLTPNGHQIAKKFGKKHLAIVRWTDWSGLLLPLAEVQRRLYGSIPEEKEDACAYSIFGELTQAGTWVSGESEKTIDKKGITPAQKFMVQLESRWIKCGRSGAEYLNVPDSKKVINKTFKLECEALEKAWARIQAPHG